MLHSLCQQIWKTQWCPQSQRKAMPKKVQITVQFHSFHMPAWLCSKFSKLGFNMNQELPDVHAGFRKGRRTRDEIANICWIIEKAREFQKNIYFCFTDYAEAFDGVDHNKLWTIFKEMEIPGHLSCLQRNLYAGQEATVRTRYWTMDCFKIEKGVHQGCILSPCLFTLYIEYTTWNVGLDQS